MLKFDPGVLMFLLGSCVCGNTLSHRAISQPQGVLMLLKATRQLKLESKMWEREEKLKYLVYWRGGKG